MRAKRVDRNQPEIVAALRKIPGTSVFCTHMVGDGWFDLVLGYRGINYLLEVKDPLQPPSGRKLTPDEQRLHANWKGQKAVVETIEDVLKIIQ